MTLKDLLDFIKPRADIQREMSRQPSERRNRINLHQETQNRCYICNESHGIEECSQFRGLSPWERMRTLTNKHACFTCLRRHGGPCKLNKLCGFYGCKGKHHRILHYNQTPQRSENKNKTVRVQDTKPAVARTHLHHQFMSEVFYQIIPVTLRNGDRETRTYAFLDPGSSLTLVDRQLVHQLQLEGVPAPLKIKWTQDFSREEKKSQRVQLKIKGTSGREFTLDNVRTAKNL